MENRNFGLVNHKPRQLPNPRPRRSMLYPRWLETARRHADRVAVIDGATGEHLTFAALAARAAAAPRARGPVFARSGDLAFLLAILQAWRDRQPVVPVERGAPAPVLAVPPPPGVVLVKPTPGATGVPRGVHFGAAELVAEVDRLAAAMGLAPDRPNLGVISLAHSYGFSNLVLPLLLHGVPLHALPVPFPQAVAAAFAAHRRLTVPAVPSIWRAWLRSGVLERAPIATAISAGAPLPLALEHQVHAATGIKIHNFYGASECGGISLDTSATPRSDPHDVGSPLPGVRVTTHPGGRLLVESDAVALGYDQPRPADLLGGGRFLTHDLGRIEHGHVLLTGTTGAAINVAGRKISPAKVEAALAATGLTRRVRVFGTPSPDPDRVEEIIGMVELAPGASVDDLRQAAAKTLAGWELPRHWWTNPPLDAWALDAAALRRHHAMGC